MNTIRATPRRWGMAHERLGALYRSRAEVGMLPPQPPTARARFGSVLVRGTRRALFWLLPQLDRFHACVIEAAEEDLRALEELAAAYERLDGALGRTLMEFARRQRELEAEVGRLRAELRAAGGAEGGRGR